MIYAIGIVFPFAGGMLHVQSGKSLKGA